jgi:microcystin-dependent protein
MTIATPCVFTKVAHGYVVGDKVNFTTTGGFPSGLSANTDYYIISAGLTADAFEVALTPAGAAINTTGSQSGVHTVYLSNFGKGDGSTTFNVPDLRSRIPVGFASSAPTITLSFDPSQVDTANDWVTILDTTVPSQGQKVQLTSTGTLPAGLSLATDYYIIRVSTTTVAFASSQGNSNAATQVKVNITDTGSGVHTMTYTNNVHTVLGRLGGEEKHGMSVSEMPAHTHSAKVDPTSGGGGGSSSAPQNGQSGSTGGDALHNNMQPFMVLNYIIKT